MNWGVYGDHEEGRVFEQQLHVYLILYEGHKR